MTRDDIIRMAREAGFYIDQDWIDHGLPGFERFAALVAAAERAECVQVCIRLCDQVDLVGADECIDAIKQHFGMNE